MTWLGTGPGELHRLPAWNATWLALLGFGAALAVGRCDRALGAEYLTVHDDGIVTETLSAGSFHTSALKRNGTVACWGDDLVGQATPPAGLGNFGEATPPPGLDTAASRTESLRRGPQQRAAVCHDCYYFRESSRGATIPPRLRRIEQGFGLQASGFGSETAGSAPRHHGDILVRSGSIPTRGLKPTPAWAAGEARATSL